MNWSHLKALVWLRWRLFLASSRRAGITTRVVMGLLMGLIVISSVAGFAITLLLGIHFIPKASPFRLLLVWDLFVFSFLMFWCIGFSTELQRSEPISLDKLLHLPLSLQNAFLLNFFSTFASLTMFAFLPAMLAFCLALVYANGPKMLLVPLLLAAVLLLIVSLTFQLRGWLAILISQPRARRTVLVLFTALFVISFQVPNFINIYVQRASADAREATQKALDTKLESLETELAANGLTAAEREALEAETTRVVEEFEMARKAERRESKSTMKRWLLIAHHYIPFAWLPYGTYRAAEGSVWQGLLAAAALFGLSGLSLRASYRATVRHYRQDAPPRKGPSRKSREAAIIPPKSRNRLRRPFPGCNPQIGTLAKANFCSLLRAPEVKMQLLSPIFVTVLLAFAIFGRRDAIPAEFSQVVAFGTMALALVSTSSLLFNQFGYDRQGFRAFLLFPISGRDVLLGKNMGLLPLTLTIPIAIVIGVLYPLGMPVLDGVACLPAGLAMYCVMATVGNLTSIRFPLAISTSTLRKARPPWSIILVQLGMTLLLPLLISPIGIPFGVQLACRHFNYLSGVPIALLLELVVAAVAIALYFAILPVAGTWLHARGEYILAEVTKRDAS